VLALVLALVPLLGAGCTAARNGLGTNISSCFRVLPTAKGTAEGGSRRPVTFVGLQWIGTDRLVHGVAKPGSGGPPPPPSLEPEHRLGVCAVAYRGVFSASSVTRPWVPGAGPYRIAIVVVRQSNNRVLATVLLARVPRGLHFAGLT
jgi:hypothetical protein